MTPTPVAHAVPPPKRRLLRPFNAAAATLAYFARHFTKLFRISWFPFLLLLVCVIALTALAHAQPPLLPEWLFFREWDPPTWLKAFVTAPFAAMVLSYVLRDMSGTYADRAAWRIDPLGFELSRPILGATLFLAAFNVWAGMLKLFRRALGAMLIIALYGSAFNDTDVRLWIVSSGPIKAVLEAAVAMWCYLLAGQMIVAGKINITHQVTQVWQVIRGNWLRLLVLCLLIGAVQEVVVFLSDLIVYLLGPFTSWIYPARQQAWSLQDELIRQVIYIPFTWISFLAYYLLPAIAVGVVLQLQPPADHPMPSRSPD
jgi:hypothetical protein